MFHLILRAFTNCGSRFKLNNSYNFMIEWSLVREFEPLSTQYWAERWWYASAMTWGQSQPSDLLDDSSTFRVLFLYFYFTFCRFFPKILKHTLFYLLLPTLTFKWMHPFSIFFHFEIYAMFFLLMQIFNFSYDYKSFNLNFFFLNVSSE